MTKTAVSVLSADFSKIPEWLPKLEKAKADFIHWDIMDNKYVPNKGVDQSRFAELKELTKISSDVHLMVETPENAIKGFLQGGAKMVSFHLETTKKAGEIIDEIHEHSAKAGIAINNREDITRVEEFIEKTDFFLVMTVEAGFGGQEFIERNLEKIKYLAKRRKELGLKFEIEVDGGINDKTGKKAVKAGADILVAGNYIIKNKSIEKAIESLKKLG
jgi:ribulose-phosphate 3-epimerase